MLFVGDAGTVVFERITVTGFAPPNGRGSPIADSVFWPSVQLAPGATVSRVPAEALDNKLCFVLAHVLCSCLHSPIHIVWHPDNRDEFAAPRLTVTWCMLQIVFDTVELRYQRRPEYADCGAFQVCMCLL